MFNKIESDGNLSANCSGIADIPFAGRVFSPSARHLKMKSNSLEVVSSSGSKKIPPKKGRKNLVIMDSENPSFFSKSIVGSSSDVRICSSDFVRTPIRVIPISSLSKMEPMGLVSDFAESNKWRSGSATVWNLPSWNILAPE